MNIAPGSLDLTALVDWWSLVLLHSLWTAVVATVAVICLYGLIGRQRAGLRCAVAMVALVLTLVSSVALASRPERASPVMPLQFAPLADTPPHRINEDTNTPNDAQPMAPTDGAGDISPIAPLTPLTLSIRRTAVYVWLMGSIVMHLRLAFSHASAWKLVAGANVETPLWLHEMIADLASRLGLLRSVAVRMGQRVAGPMVYGFFRPVILLPADLLDRLPGESIRVLLAHELAHLRRGDLVFGLLQRMIESVLFFHPSVWWLSRQMDREREVACDALAASVIGDRSRVAAALIDYAELASRPIPVAASGANGGSLEERVERLVAPTGRHRWRISAGSFGLLAASGVTGLICLMMESQATVAAISDTPDRPGPADASIVEREDLEAPPNGGEPTRVAISGRWVVPAGGSVQEVLAGSFGGRIYIQSENFRLNAALSVDGEGRFEYVVPDPETALARQPVVYVAPNLQGYSQQVHGPFDLNQLPLDLGELKLNSGLTTLLRILDPSGNPVTGATIETATRELTDGGGRQTQELLGVAGATSDSNGHIRLHHLAADPVVVSLVKPGYAAARREILPGDDATVTWTLTAAQPLAGRFVDQTGNGVPGVEVHLARSVGAVSMTNEPRHEFLRDRTGAQHSQSRLAVSDRDGRFQVDALHGDTRYWLMSLHADFRPTVIRNVTAAEQVGRIELRPPLVVSGRIAGDLTALRTRSGRPFIRYNNRRKTDYGFSVDPFDCDVDAQGQFRITQLFAGSVGLTLPTGDGKHKTITVNLTRSINDMVIDLARPDLGFP